MNGRFGRGYTADCKSSWNSEAGSTPVTNDRAAARNHLDGNPACTTYRLTAADELWRAFQGAQRQPSPPRYSHVSTTVSGFSDTLSIPSSINQRARSG